MSKLNRFSYIFSILFLLALGNLKAQTTPPGANSNTECGTDCWDLFSWSPVQDGSGANIPNFGEGLASTSSCNTIIDASVEYSGVDVTPDLIGTSIGANSQGTSTDSWELSFGAELTNPVIAFSALRTSSIVSIMDCDGNEISATCISSCGSSLVYTPGVGWTGDAAYSLQLDGTYDCLNITAAVINSDAYSFSVGTCLGADLPPPCVDCPANTDYKYLTLVNSMDTDGDGKGDIADVNLNGVLYGTATVLFDDLDINTDLAGSAFGAFDNDGGTFILQIELCEPIEVNQLDILGLETESQASIGTSISGSSAAATLSGLTLSACGGTKATMLPNGNIVTNTSASCSNQGNGKYTVAPTTTDILYFKYHNPPSGCTFDKATFRIATCVPEGADAIPVCPLTYVTYATDIEDYVLNGPDFTGSDANAFQVMRDANGNFFDQNCTQIQNEVDNMIAIPTTTISPCAEVVEEEDCFFCDPPPPCAECPAGSEYEFISLANAQDIDGDGLEEGSIFLNGVCYGTFDVVYSDLDVNEDVSGTQFGGFDNDGGVYILQLDFCEPLAINQLDIRGLEVNSEVSVGTAISGTPGPGSPATLTGLDLNWCAGSTRMLPEDPPVNMVKTDGPGCSANPNASYVLDGNPTVSTLYFQYHNPPGNCTYDYVGFRLGTCYTPPPMAVPTCPFEEVRVTCDMDDVIENGISNANTDVYVIDGAGNYFDYTNCNATALIDAYNDGTALQLVDIGCADLVETVDECIPADCVVPTTCASTSCPADASFSYINLDQQGTNAAGNPEGIVVLDNVKIGTYEFLFSDLDVSEDGNGTTFGGWDNDGGTMLLRVDFCEPLLIQELDVRNLEVASEITVGTAASSNDASAVLSGLSLTVCDDASGRMGVGPAPNQVITDGPGCSANPNATYTVSGGAVSTLFFKYHNAPGGCRGDYVGFRIGACTPDPVMAIPTCPLNLFEIDDCPDDPNNATTTLYQDVNGNWFPNNICTDPVDTLAIEVVSLSPCASTLFLSECEFCCEFTVECPTSNDLGTFDCTQLATIPAAPTTLAAVSAAPYNVVVGDTPCGDIVVSSMDDGTPDVCTTGGQTITRTVTIFDDLNGNGTYDATDEDPPVDCTFTYTITEDTTPPEVTCMAQDEIHECNGLAGNEAAADAWNTAQITALTNCSSDICGDISVSSDYAFANLSDDCGFTGTMTVTFTIEDDCGDNTVTQTATFTIVDTTDPFACDPVDETHQCDGLAGNMAAAMAWNDANMAALVTCSNDVCGTVTVTNNFDFNDLSDECGLTGDMTVTYTITDECGNFVTRFATFTIIDTTAPTITCPAGQTLTCFETIPTPVMTPADFLALGGTITDICTPNLDDFTVFSQDADNGGDNCPGNARVVVRTYFVNDDCGNTTTCEQTFTYLESTQAPVITSVLPACYKYCADLANPMEADITYDTDCAFGATVNIAGPTQIGQDNCPGSIYRYTYTVTDDCGRTSAPVTRDFIIGNDGPTIECAPFNLFLECGDDNNSDYIEQHVNTVNVNTSCELGYTLNYFPQNFNNISCGSSTVVTFVATDACGRTASCTTTIAVEDNTPPTITAVPATGFCDVTNCSADVNYWFNHWKNYVVDGMAAEDACDTNVSIQASNNPLNTDCPNGDAETVVTFTATDNCGNTSFITGTFTVEATPESLNILGAIATEAAASVEAVEVSLEGSTLSQAFVTEADGAYQFGGLTVGENYSVTPFLDEDHLNGVSSFDMVLITKHILQLQSLDSPYKMIAADINKSGSITTMDLVELRKLILHIDEAFAQNTSWRFVEADFVFPLPTNPFATIFPEEVNINGLSESEIHDFVAVKIGDVNGSATANGLTGAEDRTFNGELILNVPDQQLIAGESYSIPFNADNFNGIHGYQFTLDFDASVLSFDELQAAALNDLQENNFGFGKTNEGLITTSWTSSEATTIARGTALFQLNFTAKKDAKLSEVLTLNSRQTVAEAYDKDLELMDVRLRFNGSENVLTQLRLFQNRPNPFDKETIIGFELPEAGRATLNIYNTSGKLLTSLADDFSKGYNQFEVSGANLTAGLLYYTLVTDKQTATRKMIVKK